MRFWDSSAILPLCLTERETAALRRILDEDESIAAWWGTPVECFSAFARLRREKLLTTAEESRAREFLSILAASWTEIQPTQRVRDGAARALLLHPLRAADSLQLSAALLWAHGDTTGCHFVCLDQGLRQAARREGFVVLPEQPAALEG